MKLTKKLAAFVLALALCISLLPTYTFAAEAHDTLQDEKLAYDLYALNLFKGVSQRADGSPDFALPRPPIRCEAIVMLIRLLGKEPEALYGNFEHPFTDVEPWADKYVGYAYQSGLTKGVSDTQFGFYETASGSMYLTYVLRALGYSDTKGDFNWNYPYALSTYCGILPLTVNSNLFDFKRYDALEVSYAALSAKLKGSNQTLAEKLITDGIFTQAQFDKFYDKKAFSDSDAVNKAVSDALIANEAKELGTYQCAASCHLIMDTLRDGDNLTVSAMICYNTYTYNKYGEALGGMNGCMPAMISLKKLSDGSYQTTNYWTSLKARNDPSTVLPARFSDVSLRIIDNYNYYRALYAVCDTQKNEYLASGALKFIPKNYENLLADALSDTKNSVKAYLNSPKYGTVLWTLYGGGMHGLANRLVLLTNSNSPLGEAKYIYFPLPRATVYLPAEPEKLALDESGDTLTYQVTFADEIVIYNSPTSQMIIHRKGTYYYSADLATGEVTETFAAG